MSDDITRNPLIPRPTVYRGVQMRSRLEAAWAEQFDAFGWVWRYEPQCFATPDGQYLPDFQVSIPYLSEHTYVEVKPSHFVTPEGNGWNGNLDNIDGPDGWNAAHGHLHAKVRRLHDIIAANAQIDLFLVCTSANEGQVAIHEFDPLTPDNEQVPVVAPALCVCGHVSLAQHAGRTGCSEHLSTRWTGVPDPVPSLYAPRGFLVYEQPANADPLHERLALRRGR